MHGRTAKQSYTGIADWDFVAEVARSRLDSGVRLRRLRRAAADRRAVRQGVSGVFVGRGVLRNPWILAQATTCWPDARPRVVTPEERGAVPARVHRPAARRRSREADGFRHVAPGQLEAAPDPRARSRERWVVNKVRALCTWYTKGLDAGSHLRIAINAAPSIAEVREIIDRFFRVPGTLGPRGTAVDDTADEAAALAGH